MVMVRQRRDAGFTLIELLVAVAVIAIALGALIQAGVTQARNATYLTERTYTQWVAENVVASFRATRRWPDIGVTTGREAMGSRMWPWRMTTEGTADSELRRLRIEVFRDPERRQPVSTLIAYLDQPRVSAP